MDNTTKLRRSGIICLNFIRNYAYYKAGWNEKQFSINDQFWISLNGNFIDICVLEWCKLFGDDKELYHWKKIMNEDQTFKERMFITVGINQHEIDKLFIEAKHYRDKFIAHLDSHETMRIPKFDKGLEMVFFYCTEARKKCPETQGWPEDLKSFYNKNYQLALHHYNLQNTSH